MACCVRAACAYVACAVVRQRELIAAVREGVGRTDGVEVPADANSRNGLLSALDDMRCVWGCVAFASFACCALTVGVLGDCSAELMTAREELRVAAGARVRTAWLKA